MMGFETPGDQRVAVTMRDWNAMKLALWRSKAGWEIVARQAAEIVQACHHLDNCPGKTSETEPCFGGIRLDSGPGELGCPDRELRMSALVILNAARQFAPIEARKVANETYFAPSREYFSEVMSALSIAQAELEAMEALGVRIEPPTNGETEPKLLTERAPVAIED
jgi:hypothetical protein